MKGIKMDVTTIQPSQLYINEGKLAKIEEYLDAVGYAKIEPLPVKKLGNTVFFTDGHTRAFAMYQRGITEIRVYWDTDDLDWTAYLQCLDWCTTEGVRGIPDLATRVVSEQTYQQVWLERCGKMHESLVKDPDAAYTIQEIQLLDEKRQICDQILRSLPDWFGIESAIEDYEATIGPTQVWGAFVGSYPIGFVSIKDHNPATSEIYVMGIYAEFHRRGIGHRLLDAVTPVLKRQGKKFLTVKTLSASHPDLYYQRTREFYGKAGFFPLEEFKSLWGDENPCLFLVRPL